VNIRILSRGRFNVNKAEMSSPYVLATIYAGLGEKDQAFQYLEKAFDERSLDISWNLKSDVRIDVSGTRAGDVICDQ